MNNEKETLSEEELDKTTGGYESGIFINYTVVRSDNLIRLAQRFGTSIREIMRLNPIITNPNQIREGWVLRIPDNR